MYGILSRDQLTIAHNNPFCEGGDDDIKRGRINEEQLREKKKKSSYPALNMSRAIAQFRSYIQGVEGFGLGSVYLGHLFGSDRFCPVTVIHAKQSTDVWARIKYFTTRAKFDQNFSGLLYYVLSTRLAHPVEKVIAYIPFPRRLASDPSSQNPLLSHPA